MIGSIIGDIVGSIYEFNNIKQKDFPFFTEKKEYTDDSVLTLATADWLMKGGESGKFYYEYAVDCPNPMGAYGTMFLYWISMVRKGIMQPYNSCGNGSAMRVGPVGWAFETKEEVMKAAKESAECTHNHPEGIKGAQAVALCVFMARKGVSKDEMMKTIEDEFGYDLHFTCDEIRENYEWGGMCQDSVSQAIRAFLDGNDFEDCIRTAVSIGGDSDTIACITGSIAEAFYGIPRKMYEEGMEYLPERYQKVVRDFEERFGNKIK